MQIIFFGCARCYNQMSKALLKALSPQFASRQRDVVAVS